MNNIKIPHVLKRLTIKAAFSILHREVVKHVNLTPIQPLLEKYHNNYKDLVDKLTDKNPNDKQQVEVWWAENKRELLSDTIEGITESIENFIEDPEDAMQVIEMLKAKWQEQQERKESAPIAT